MRRIALLCLLPLLAYGWQSSPSSNPPIPARTRFDGLFKTALNSKTAKLGDAVTVEVVYPGRAGNKIVIPQHSLLQGSVVSVLPFQKKERRGGLAVKFTELDTPSGAKIPLEAVIYQAYIDKFSSAGDAPDASLSHSMPSNTPGQIELSMNSGKAVKGIHGLALYIVGGDASAFMEKDGDVKIATDQPLRLRLITLAPKQ